MNNYFYAELKKALSEEKLDKSTTPQCEIDHIDLEEYYITLECGHTFNYEAIFNAVNENKNSCTHYSKLTRYQIKCPYCRNIQNKLLPYYKTLLNKKIYGVNHPDQYTMYNNLCDYKFKSGKNKGHQCGNKCYFTKCNTHFKLSQDNPVFNSNDVDYKNLKNYTVIMLRKIAKYNKCKNYSKLKKNDLITNILDKYNEQSKKE